MDKFKTIAVGGLGLILDDFRWFFGRLTNPNDGMYEAFNNLLRGYGDNFIVQGVVASGTTPNVAITEGWVILDGELIKVDAQTGINTTTNNKFVKVTTFDSRGTKTFLNGSINETYEKNRAVVQGTSGNLDFDANTLNDIVGLTEWTDFEFNGNDFVTGNQGPTNWVVELPGDVTNARFRIRGKTVDIQISINNSGFTGPPGNDSGELRIENLPFSAKNVGIGVVNFIINGTSEMGFCQMDASANRLRVFRGDQGNYPASTNALDVRLSMTIEIE